MGKFFRLGNVMKRRSFLKRSDNDYLADYYRKQTYGISIEQYNQMFAEQGGCCAICGKHQKEFKSKRRLCIDHNHKTGQIRALLCPNCNVIIGKANERVELLAKIAEYIEKWSI